MTMLPLVNMCMYEKNSEVRNRAVKCLLAFTESGFLTEEDKEIILKFILQLSHEEGDEVARATSLQILNKLSKYLDPEICESFIVIEVKSLSIDKYAKVRERVAGNLVNIC